MLSCSTHTKNIHVRTRTQQATTQSASPRTAHPHQRQQQQQQLSTTDTTAAAAPVINSRCRRSLIPKQWCLLVVERCVHRNIMPRDCNIHTSKLPHISTQVEDIIHALCTHTRTLLLLPTHSLAHTT